MYMSYSLGKVWFQFTRAGERATESAQLASFCSPFQFTRAGERATLGQSGKVAGGLVSIHARWGARDLVVISRTCTCSGFNSRALGSARHARWYVAPGRIVSIHARWGARDDPSNAAIFRDWFRFNSRALGSARR